MGAYALKYSGKEIDIALDKVNQDLLSKVHNTDITAHADIRAAIPTKTSELDNDSGFITADTMPDVDVSGAITMHDTDAAAHEDIRQEISNKANNSDLSAHTTAPNPHNVTLEQLGLKSETWTFTLEDGTEVTKVVYVKND